MNYKQFSLLFGLSVWLLATLTFSFWGHTFFIIKKPLIVFSLFFGTIPILYVLQKWIFNKFNLNKNEKLKSTILMSLPGMFLDTLCINYHSFVFPSFSFEQAITLASWVLWVYAIVLTIGFVYNVEKHTMKN